MSTILAPETNLNDARRMMDGGWIFCSLCIMDYSNNFEAEMIDLKTTTQVNNESLRVYRELLAQITDSQLAISMPAGWTVSAVLAHLAFWDQRAIVLLDKWEKDGIEFAPNEVDIVNDSTLPLCLAIPGRAAVKLFLEIAEKVDRRVALLDPEWVETALEKGKTVKFDRAHHRMTHLGDLKKVLGKA
jgi:hypothetical protein